VVLVARHSIQTGLQEATQFLALLLLTEGVLVLEMETFLLELLVDLAVLEVEVNILAQVAQEILQLLPLHQIQMQIKEKMVV
jgi:hypothetical protein